MRSEPSIAATAALIGDTGRAAMLTALMDGRALAARELAAAAGLSAAAASAHLAKLLDGGLLTVQNQGRHRYYRLAETGIASILESLAAQAGQPIRPHTVHTPHVHALRHARICYDHLAGELGIEIAVAMESRGLLSTMEGEDVVVTAAGATWFADTLSINVSALRPGRRGIAYRCLDWTERLYHLAGPLGAELLARCCALGWIVMSTKSRVLQVTPRGRDGLRDHFGIRNLRAMRNS